MAFLAVEPSPFLGLNLEDLSSSFFFQNAWKETGPLEVGVWLVPGLLVELLDELAPLVEDEGVPKRLGAHVFNILDDY